MAMKIIVYYCSKCKKYNLENACKENCPNLIKENLSNFFILTKENKKEIVPLKDI